MIDLKLSKEEMQGLTEEQIEIAKARKLEILVLPILKRNLRFFYAGGDLQGKAKAYRQPMDRELLEKTMKKGDSSIATVCKPLCDLIAQILRDNGVDADTVSCDTDMFRHTDVLIKTKSGKRYIINYLEDIENIQSGMKTPDFASKPYYERRYKKFEDRLTTDGKSLEGIDFLTEDELKRIDNNLGYTKYNMYMNDVIEQIKKEFLDFRTVMAENDWISEQAKLEKNDTITEGDKEKIKKEIFDKYNNMTDEQELECKLDWIFECFNDRMDVKGHADFVMYYSRLLLKEVLTEEEYRKITRYDCFVKPNNIPERSKIEEILDIDNSDNKQKSRFCLLEMGDKIYGFSTKPNAYVKLDKSELKEISEYANISKSEKPSDLMLYLCDRGNALPLVFHPLGAKLLNERADLIEENLNEEERRKIIEELSKQIKTTDEPITSILIPYPNGEEKYIYINKNDEFVVRTKNEETIYHYNEENDSFDEEVVIREER